MSIKAVRSIVDREMRVTQKKRSFIHLSQQAKSDLALEMFLAVLAGVFILSMMAVCLYFSSAAQLAGLAGSGSVAVLGSLALIVAGGFMAVAGTAGIKHLNKEE